MSIESELNPHYYRTESIAEINPSTRYSGKGERYFEQEKNFLKQLSCALGKLGQRDDMRDYYFVTERQDNTGLVVIMCDQEGRAVARLTPEHCIEMAKKSDAEGLLIEIQC